LSDKNLKIKIVIYDDNVKLVNSLVELINDNEDCLVVGIFNQCIDCVSTIEELNPDIVIMDINMPNMSGIEGTRLIKSKFPHVQIVIQTVYNDVESIFEAISAGASGYLLKGASSDELIQAIKDVYNGGAPISSSIARKMLDKLQHKTTVNHEYKLSNKEHEVLTLLVNGLPYKLIADKMNITYDTVRAHIKKIYDKLHVSSMTEAVVKAIKNNII
jgi:DNA-binding NarL/FixJ family response regulator